jgi:hypothetical protein
VALPLTVLRLTECTSPVESMSIAPETVSTVARFSEPVAATSPETLLALSAPSSPRTWTSPDTALIVRSPVRPSTMMSPDTVLRRAGSFRPATRALALTTPRLRATERGTATLISALGPLAVKLRNTSRKLSQRSCG